MEIIIYVWGKNNATKTVPRKITLSIDFDSFDLSGIEINTNCRCDESMEMTPGKSYSVTFADSEEITYKPHRGASLTGTLRSATPIDTLYSFGSWGVWQSMIDKGIATVEEIEQ